MDRNPERITFDPFVLPYETPLGHLLSSFLMFYGQKLLHWETRHSGWACDGRPLSTFLYIHICDLANMGGS